jgi:hypothetical protein
VLKSSTMYSAWKAGLSRSVMQMTPGKHLTIPCLLASPQDGEHGYTQARLGA